MYLSIGIPIYNEESSITNCLEHLQNATKSFKIHYYLCLNGCTDNSNVRIKQWMNKTKQLNYTLLYSTKGKTIAQNTIISAIRENGHSMDPVLFLDADVWVDELCVERLYTELFRIKRLLVVGALTVPVNGKRRIRGSILNIRNKHPESEISLYDVKEYKWYAYTYPQAETDPDWEIRSKIYFHGRCFMLKRAELFKMPDDNRVFDDTYIPNALHYEYGPGIIRTIYSAKVYYKAYESLVLHWRTYWRVYNDKAYIDKNYTHFQLFRKMEKTVLDKAYIRTLSTSERLLFLLYQLVIKTEELSYRLLPLIDAREIWSYKRK